jgi:hypothetical protein
VALEEFDCLVLGDEPAGLWALNRLAHSSPPKGSWRLGWVSLTKRPVGACIPVRLMNFLGLTSGNAWTLEIVTPEESFLWEEKALESRFPGLDLNQFQFLSHKGEIRPRARDLSKIASLIRRYPELFIYAGGVWKFMGRSDRMRPENLVWGALLCSELVTWHAADEMPTSVTRIAITENAPENSIEEIRKVSALKNDGLLLKLRGREPILTRKLILNASLGRLISATVERKELIHSLNLDGDISSPVATYPLILRVKSQSIPCPVRPLTLYFETSEIPDLDSEVWPIQRIDLADGTTEIVLWVSALKDISLEGVLDNFRMGMKRLNRLFPFLSTCLLEVGVPLAMDSCFTLEQRNQVRSIISNSAVEVYGLTTIDTSTRMKNLYSLSPFVHCELPYPLGPLQQVRRIVQGLVGKPTSPSEGARSESTLST